MVSELQAEAMLEYRPGVFHALGTVASDPSYRANADRRLFLEVSGDYTPRQKIVGDSGSTVGHKLLGQLKKVPTAQLLELLGTDAMEIMKELEEELEDSDQQSADLPSQSSDQPDEGENAN